jgi:hypothetical protein
LGEREVLINLYIALLIIIALGLIYIYWLFIWYVLLYEFKELSKAKIILTIFFALLLIFILPYIFISYQLIFDYIEVVYQVILLYMLYIFLIYIFALAYPLFKQYKILVFTLATIFWLYPASIITKPILEAYIENVALKKYGKHIKVNVKINGTMLSYSNNSNVSFDDKRWSFRRKDFITSSEEWRGR